jgi:hypothetical protein
MATNSRKEGDQVQENAKVVVKDIKVMAEDLVKTVRDALKEGNVRRITVKDKEGRVIASFPLAVGVIGTLLSPVLAALGALSALLTECTVSIEKVS